MFSSEMSPALLGIDPSFGLARGFLRRTGGLSHFCLASCAWQGAGALLPAPGEDVPHPAAPERIYLAKYFADYSEASGRILSAGQAARQLGASPEMATGLCWDWRCFVG